MNLQILVVEDDKNIRDVISCFLESLGHKVLTVDSGEKAIEILAKSKPDMMITDLNLGEYRMNGHELLLKTKDIHPTLNIVMMTAFHDVKGAVSAMKGGAVDYLCKPFNITDLEALIQKVINDKNSIPSLESLEKKHIVRVLAETETYEQAAATLGINMATLWRKRKTYCIK